MVDFIKKFVKTELFMYLFIGFLTTVVNIVAFQLLCNAFNASEKSGWGWKFAEILAFIIAVAFAFITNKLFVFQSKDMSLNILGKEAVGFVVGRVVTEVINFAMMWYMIDKKGINELLTKIITSVVVIVLNYLISKFLVFKKSDVENEKG